MTLRSPAPWRAAVPSRARSAAGPRRHGIADGEAQARRARRHRRAAESRARRSPRPAGPAAARRRVVADPRARARSARRSRRSPRRRRCSAERSKLRLAMHLGAPSGFALHDLDPGFESRRQHRQRRRREDEAACAIDDECRTASASRAIHAPPEPRALPPVWTVASTRSRRPSSSTRPEPRVP